nr:MAG TPA: hypothetical protein [Caudoviricetes sp.]
MMIMLFVMKFATNLIYKAYYKAFPTRWHPVLKKKKFFCDVRVSVTET